MDFPVSYGPNIEGLVGQLHARQYLPFKRMQELFNEVMGTKISEVAEYIACWDVLPTRPSRPTGR